jgi:EcoRII C terminal/Restriction endonuclease EcoRII, N-terminal
MNDIAVKAIKSVQDSEIAFSKFITANDTGATGGHQSGYHIHKNSYSLFFDKPGVKGENRDVYIKIKWQDDFETESRFIYYGVGTRNEYRLTRFGRGFPFLQEENVGDLLIVCKSSKDYYAAFVLSSDEDIEDFFTAFGISSTETNCLIPKTRHLSSKEKLVELFQKYIESLIVEFPSSTEVALTARKFFTEVFSHDESELIERPDNQILNFLGCEFELFKAIENSRYGERIKTPFASVEELIEFSNTILNRRKSRAGKSLEHHLAEVFTANRLRFETQAVIDGNKKPDFIFPGSKEYQNFLFSADNLVFLGAKTTCKDRWRQILNEAERIPQKHLFTLQQGISSNQLKEMVNERVTLVVPKPYIPSFPIEYRDKILSLHTFIQMVRQKQI